MWIIHLELFKKVMSELTNAIGYPLHSLVNLLFGTLANSSPFLKVPRQYSEHRAPVYAPKTTASMAEAVWERGLDVCNVVLSCWRMFISKDQALLVGPSHFFKNESQ